VRFVARAVAAPRCRPGDTARCASHRISNCPGTSGRARLPAQSGCDTATVIVQIVVPIFGDVTGDGCGRTVRYLDAKTIIEVQLFTHLSHVPMLWKQGHRKIAQLGRSPDHLRVGGREQVPMQVRRHVGPRRMIDDAPNAGIQEPVGAVPDAGLARHELAAAIRTIISHGVKPVDHRASHVGIVTVGKGLEQAGTYYFV